MQEQKISGYNTSHLESDSQMPYRNLFFFKDLNMKTLLKKVKIWPGNTKNLWSIHWDHLQLSPISWDYPFNADVSLKHGVVVLELLENFVENKLEIQ